MKQDLIRVSRYDSPMLSLRDSLRKALPALLLFAAPLAIAQPPAPISPVEMTQWRSGLLEINEGWATREGDNVKWSQTAFDDSNWKTVDIEDIGPAQPGWRWFRKRVNVGPDANVQLLLEGGGGIYELYVNGVLMPDARLRSPLAVSRPSERVFPLSDDRGEFVLALRTRTPSNYAGFHYPLFLAVTLGQPTVIGYERQSLESDRLYSVLPSVAINLLLCLAGFGAFALFASQRSEREYLFLGLFLLAVGLEGGVFSLQQFGVLPTSFNLFLADACIYATTILQIEFTFSFARRRPGRNWRIYQAVLVSTWLLVLVAWPGYLSFDLYGLIEGAVNVPAGLLLSALLLTWYRHGNDEAGWLILPSLFPAVTIFLLDLGSASLGFGWHWLTFLINPIPVGPISLQPADVGDLFFLLAIAIVMFFRFTRVSREQARSAAELNAAREIQQRLVPASLPHVDGYSLEAAYLPAEEVGGDFYQVLAQADGATLVVVGDVSGKGLKAAMTGALAIGALRTLSSEGLSPAVLLTRLNLQLLQTQDAGFITCLCARINQSGQVFIANAGHLSPYRNGSEVPVDSGLPLGIAAEAEYTESFLQLYPEDSLTLLSDGVLEARNATGDLLGFERTREISNQSAASIALAAQSFGQEDDITVLTVRFSPAKILQP